MEYNDFTHLYQRSITLQFGLLPIGQTLQHIQANGILEEDVLRAERYKKVKELVDEYHTCFIQRVLTECRLKVTDSEGKDSLSEYLVYYRLPRTDEREQKAFATIQENLRKQIVNHFKKDEAFKSLFTKGLIQNDLKDPRWMRPLTTEETAVVESFGKFTTYFTGFHQNRENMYTSEAQSTAIAFRLIHENLPKFIDNINVFEQLSGTEALQHCNDLYTHLEEQLHVNNLKEVFRLGYFNHVLTQSQIDVYNTLIGGKSFEDGTRLQGLNEHVNLYNQTHPDHRLPKFKVLFKQLLSDRQSLSWLPAAFQEDNEVLQAILKECNALFDNALCNHQLPSLLKKIGQYQLSGIYISNDTQLTHISQALFKDWNAIQRAIITQLKKSNPQKRKETEEDYFDRIVA